MAGSNNDINMLQPSMIFSRLAERNSSEVHYKINDYAYNRGTI
jgi:hypothetical protein